MWGFWKLSFQNWCSDCMELVGYLFFGITGTFFVMWSVTELWTVHLKLKQIYTLDMKLNNWRICYVIQILAVSLLIFVWFALYVSEKSVWNCWFVCFFMVLSAVQSLSHVRLFATPWTTARQASLSITNSRSPPKPMSIESVMPSNHLIHSRPLLLPSIFPSIRVFSNESALCIFHGLWVSYPLYFEALFLIHVCLWFLPHLDLFLLLPVCNVLLCPFLTSNSVLSDTALYIPSSFDLYLPGMSCNTVFPRFTFFCLLGILGLGLAVGEGKLKIAVV